MDGDAHWLLGVDLGGTKVECAAVRADGTIGPRRRVPTPQADYAGTLQAIAAVLAEVESELGPRARAPRPLGVAIPGSESPLDARIRNANSRVLNGRALARDLTRELGRPVRLCNDANALAASEAAPDGAAGDCDGVFAAILGTGVGAGIACGGRVLAGANSLAGEWGHNPLPWPRPAPAWQEWPPRRCWCGQSGCVEAYLCGGALAADHARARGAAAPSAGGAQAVLQAMRDGDPSARAAWVRYCDRLARALAQVINLLDPECIVLGGGLSLAAELYEEVPARWSAWVFSPQPPRTRLVRARHGDSSGVRGAAWLWRDLPAR